MINLKKVKENSINKLTDNEIKSLKFIKVMFGTKSKDKKKTIKLVRGKI